MKRKLALILALFLAAGCLLGGCGDKYAEEKAVLQGTWQGEVDVTERANRELKDAFLALMGKNNKRIRSVLRDFDQLTLTVQLAVEPDGCYSIYVTEDSVQDCFEEAKALSKGMVADYCKLAMDAAGKDVLPEDMIEAADVPLTRVDAQLDANYDAPVVHDTIHRLRQQGYCDITGKGLLLSEEAGGEPHTSVRYTMDDGVLTLEAAEGELPHFCPESLKKIF